MTKEEMRFQCLRIAQESRPALTTSSMVRKKVNLKSSGFRKYLQEIDSLIVEAQKIYDWILK